MYDIKIFEGILNNVGGCYVLVVVCFNSFVVEVLLVGVVDILVCYGVVCDDIEIICVFGVWELLVVVKKILEKCDYDVVIVLGVVIWGGIVYFEYVVGEVVKGIVVVQNDIGVLVVFGVFIVEFIEQVIECSGIKVGNKGVEVVMFVLEMVFLFKVF